MKQLRLWWIALLSLFLVACGQKATTQHTKTTQAVTSTKHVSHQQSISSLKNTQHFLKNALEHIFEGEINRNGLAVGYHYEGLASSKAKVIESTRSKEDTHGVYRAKITIDGKEKNAFSSFFPKNWTMQQVIDTINEAYDNKKLESGNIYNGKTKSGITVQMYLNEDNKIISAFPLYNK